MDTNSLINQIQKDSPKPDPKVGMGATQIGWTDRKAYTIIAVSKSGKRCTVQRDKATRTDRNGMSDAQCYDYSRDKDGHTYEISLRKDGQWRIVGDGRLFAIGWRSEYFDYSF